MLKEMKRQRINPKVLVGLTSSSSAETLKGCADAAEGMYIPTGFAPITDAAAAVASAAQANGGFADLHSAAAWENAHIIKQVVESMGVMAKPDTLQADRRKVRDGLEALASVNGLMGEIGRVQDEGESVKPFRVRTGRRRNVGGGPRSSLDSLRYKPSPVPAGLPVHRHTGIRMTRIQSPAGGGVTVQASRSHVAGLTSPATCVTIRRDRSTFRTFGVSEIRHG